MSIQRCPNGHFFDDRKHSACPECEGRLNTPIGDVRDDSVTIARNMESDNEEKTVARALAQNDNKTIGIYQKKLSGSPVVGWLVCVDGPEKGRDYRLHAAKNFVGRSLKMDVSIPSDVHISGDSHACIIYDPKGNRFLIQRGSGETTLNNNVLSDAAELSEDSVIEIGSSKFTFVAFCKGERKW